jgi:hypothetical protein
MRRLFVFLLGLGLLGSATGCYYVHNNFIAGKCDCDLPQGYTLGYTHGYGPVDTGAVIETAKVMPEAAR